MRPNWICRPYRGVSVQRLGVALTEAAIAEHLVGRRVYRRTEVLIAEADEGHAIVTVDKEPTGDGLFWPVTAVQWIAGPDETAFVRDPEIDTGNATQMARAAAASGVGRAGLRRRGPKPARQPHRRARSRCACASSRSSRRSRRSCSTWPSACSSTTRISTLWSSSSSPSTSTSSPPDTTPSAGCCRAAAAALELAGPVDFLDSGPPAPAPDWTLLGCERSRQIHAELYGTEPAGRVEMCPRVHAGVPDGPTLVKCCLRERGIEVDGELVVVPWGATLEEVREALRLLVPAWQAAPA